MRKQKKDFEIRFYEKLIQKNPKFIHALSCLGNAYTKKGFFAQGLEVDKKIVSLTPQDPIAHYNLACSWSNLGKIDKAFSEIYTAVVLGYDDIDYILNDPDLENIRKQPEFNEFLNKINKIFSN